MFKVWIAERDGSKYPGIELRTCCVKFKRLDLGVGPNLDHMSSAPKLRSPNNIRFAYYEKAIIFIGQDDEVRT